MRPEEADENQKRVDMNQAWLKRMKRERETITRTSKSDPEFTTDDLVKMTGQPAPQVRKMLREAGVGCAAIRPTSSGFMRKTVVVRWSQLKRLAEEFGW